MSGAQALYFDGDLGLAFDDNDDSGKECSVRGCHRVLSADAQMKMCEECRGRHRVYATTKRQRRKLEKEAVTSAMASENGPGSWQSPAAEAWDPAIDPILYEDSSMQIASSSSALAELYPQEEETAACISPAMLQADTNENESPPRYCSVKGCKAVIPASYDYKMCPSCRTRYRGYGITKRAKWKTERETFEREMVHLRAAEDERRKAEGKPPLSENPEELRAWEISVIDEQIVLPQPVLAALTAAGINADGTLSTPLATNAAAAAILALYHTDPGPDAIAPLPARMCTVSHCHQILPGYYRYKRCEQHRLQNRHHSKLKRVREKEEKAGGPKEGAEVVEIPPEPKKKAKKGTHCATEGCGNALAAGKRWIHCDRCRETERKLKAQAKVATAPAMLPAEATSTSTASTPSVNSPIATVPSAEASTSAPLKMVNMTTETFNHVDQTQASFRWRSHTPMPPTEHIDLSQSANASNTVRQPLTIRHYRPRTNYGAVAEGRATTHQPYVIVEQYAINPATTQAKASVDPADDGASQAPGLQVHAYTAPDTATPGNKPYPNSRVFRHYMPTPVPEAVIAPVPGPSSSATQVSTHTHDSQATEQVHDVVQLDSSLPLQHTDAGADSGSSEAPALTSASVAPSISISGSQKQSKGSKSTTLAKGKGKAQSGSSKTQPPPPAPAAVPPASASTATASPSSAAATSATIISSPNNNGSSSIPNVNVNVVNMSALLTPQVYGYPPYGPYFYLPPQYNPNAYAPGSTAYSAWAQPMPSGALPAPPPPSPRGAVVVVAGGATGPSTSTIGHVGSSTSQDNAVPKSASAPPPPPPPPAGSMGLGGVVQVPGQVPWPQPHGIVPYNVYGAGVPAPPLPSSAATAATAQPPMPGYTLYPPTSYGYPVSAPTVMPSGSSSSAIPAMAVGAGMGMPSISAPVATVTSEPAGKGAGKGKGKEKERKFSYYHPGFGTSDLPDTPNALDIRNQQRKRRKIDPAWLEKMKAKEMEEAGERAREDSGRTDDSGVSNALETDHIHQPNPPHPHPTPPAAPAPALSTDPGQPVPAATVGPVMLVHNDNCAGQEKPEDASSSSTSTKVGAIDDRQTSRDSVTSIQIGLILVESLA